MRYRTELGVGFLCVSLTALCSAGSCGSNGAGADSIPSVDGSLGSTGSQLSPSTSVTIVKEFLPFNDSTARHCWPSKITTGPDGNLWFTDECGKIVRISSAGVITEFPIPPYITEGYSRPVGITTGPDGNIWFIEQFCKTIGRITPGGIISQFPLPTTSGHPGEIVSGPDGNLWFTQMPIGTMSTQSGSIGRITPTGTISEFPLSALGRRTPIDIVAGSDGNIWFNAKVTGNGYRVAKISVTGEITEFEQNLDARNLALGSDGKIWFTLGNGSFTEVGNITPSGESAVVSLASRIHFPNLIAGSPDGNLWFIGSRNMFGDSHITRLAPDGKVTDWNFPSSDYRANDIAPGADGSLWFVSSGQRCILGRITP